MTDKGCCSCAELLTECRAWAVTPQGLVLLSPWSSTIVPLDLDDGKLAGDWVGGKYCGSLRPQYHSAPQCNQDSQWALLWQWRQRGEMREQKPLPAGRGWCSRSQ